MVQLLRDSGTVKGLRETGLSAHVNPVDKPMVEADLPSQIPNVYLDYDSFTPLLDLFSRLAVTNAKSVAIRRIAPGSA